MRAEFLQAMQALCHANDALLVVDEVQTGVGLTSTAWAYQHLGIEPDIVAFSKKVQVGGIMAGRRVDDVADNVFAVSGRINSTWGGGLVDMVRSRRMLEVIERDQLIRQVAHLGARLLDGLRALAREHPRLVTNPRGRGLMCAFDLPSGAVRDELVRRLREEEKVLLLPAGVIGVRTRPALSISAEEIDLALSATGRALARVSP
jgi:L-lysine 6-transaminase